MDPNSVTAASYGALLAVSIRSGNRNSGMYLDGHQAERLRDFLNEVLADG